MPGHRPSCGSDQLARIAVKLSDVESFAIERHAQAATVIHELNDGDAGSSSVKS